MKLREWFKSKSTQELMMYAVIAMLLIMVASRWAYISHTAGEAVKQRFIPPQEHADSTKQEAAGKCELPADSLRTK